MEIKRGGIWYIESGYCSTVGSEQRPGRPAIVVSNDKNNKSGKTVEVVYLTTQPKRDLPTHVTIHSTSRESTAICEQITTVAVERFGDYCGEATAREMAQVNTAMLISLDLTMQTEPVEPELDPEPVLEEPPPAPGPDPRIMELETKNAVLQQMYDALLNRLIKAG